MYFAAISILFRLCLISIFKPLSCHTKVDIEHGITELHPVIKVIEYVLHRPDGHLHESGNLEWI